MLAQVIPFVGLLASGLAAGMALCILFADRTWSGSGHFYTELMQLLGRALTVPAPALGAIGLVAMLADAGSLFMGARGTPLWLDVAALAFGLAALAITRLGHFPINDRIATWDPERPPADWSSVRATWSALHRLRTIAAVASFALFLSSDVARRL